MTDIAKPITSLLGKDAPTITEDDKIVHPWLISIDYLTASARTASGKYHGKFVDFDKFTDNLANFINAGNALDRYKKLLFYGEDSNKQRFKDVASIKDGYTITDAMSVDNESEIKARYILHAILGIMTEACELAEALHGSLVSGKPLDEVNLIEEGGDLHWYEAMLYRALGTTFDASMAKNLAKLKARFPDKFTSEAANERDLIKERAILENRGLYDAGEVATS